MCTFKMCLASLETDTSFNTMLWSKWLRYHIDHTPVVFSWLSMWNWAAEASTLKYLWVEDMNVTSPESESLPVLYRSSKWGNRSRNHYLCEKWLPRALPQPSGSPAQQYTHRQGWKNAAMTRAKPGSKYNSENTRGAISSDCLVHTYPPNWII